jgi:hypothetical protein
MFLLPPRRFPGVTINDEVRLSFPNGLKNYPCIVEDKMRLHKMEAGIANNGFSSKYYEGINEWVAGFYHPKYDKFVVFLSKPKYALNGSKEKSSFLDLGSFVPSQI